MSTFSGLILGVLTAAAVTVLYGEKINSELRSIFPLELPAAGSESTQSVARLKELAIQKVLPPASNAAAVNRPVADKVETGNATTESVVKNVALEVGSNKKEADAAGKGAVQLTVGADSLQQRWDDYSADTSLFTASGDFPYQECFTRAAVAHGLPETLLLAVARGESNFNPAARSSKDAVGLMQILWPGTSKHLGIHREADLYDPCTNVSAGARYLAELSDRYNGDLHRMLAAYNYGPGRISDAPMPEGAKWYSQYIYQHLQRILGQPHVASSELLAAKPGHRSGQQVLMAFSASYRAREFMQFLKAQAPGIELAQRSEKLGLHEVVLLYQNSEERKMALQMLKGTGLLALTLDQSSVSSL